MFLSVGSKEEQGSDDTKSAHPRKMQDDSESQDAVLPLLNHRIKQHNAPAAPAALSELCVDLMSDPDTLEQRGKDAANEWKFCSLMHNTNNKGCLNLPSPYILD